jgi:hypothetical protein
VKSTPAPLTIELTSPLLTDLSRVWRAEQDGAERPTPLGDHTEVKKLLAAYEQEVAKASTERGIPAEDLGVAL